MDIIIEYEQFFEIFCYLIMFGDKINDVIGMGDNFVIWVKFMIQVCLVFGYIDNGIIYQFFGEYFVMFFMVWNYYFVRYGVYFLY